MFELKEEIIFTGFNQRTSQKTGAPYTIVNFLGQDGQTFGVMADCDIPLDLVQLDKVKVTFKVMTGRYTQLRLIDIKKV